MWVVYIWLQPAELTLQVNVCRGLAVGNCVPLWMARGRLAIRGTSHYC